MVVKISPALKKQIQRFAWTLGFTVLGLVGNEIYFLSSNPEEEIKHPLASIAQVIETQSEHERKSEGSELWNQLATGDPIYPGDAIRTSQEGSLKVKFNQTDKVIEIEPDSLVVLQVQEGKINLDLLDGNLFVKKSSDNVAQTPGAKEIVIGGESIESRMVQLKAQEQKADNGLAIEVLTPKEGESYFINPEKAEPFKVSWKRLPAEFKTELWTGPSPDKLKLQKNGDADSVAGVLVERGTLYWQVRANHQSGKDSLRTAIFKTPIVHRYAPSPVAPLNRALVRLRNSGEKTKLAWYKGPEYQSVRVEIFADAEQRKAILSETFTGDEHQLSLVPGTYYWRFHGIPVSGGEPVTSSLSSFTITQKSVTNLALQWDEGLQTSQTYVGESPILNLGWKPSTENGIRSYRVRIAADGEPLENGVTQVLTEKQFHLRLEKPGRFIASVEALDDEADKVGTTGVRRFEVKPLPLLAAPKLSNQNIESGSILHANQDGALQLQWSGQSEAESYLYQLVDRNGEKVQEGVIRETKKEFVDLLPGKYSLSLSAQDRYARWGEKRTWTVIVPEPDSLAAPVLKKWEVE